MEKEKFMLACLFIPYILNGNGSYASFTSLCSLQLQNFSKIYVSWKCYLYHTDALQGIQSGTESYYPAELK